MNPIIKFSKNWNNKLNNYCFTTIRLHNKTKYDYYHKNIGKMFDVFLEGKKHTRAKLVVLQTMKFEDIPKSLLSVDTGKFNYFENVDIMKKFGMYDIHSLMIILLFEKV